MRTAAVVIALALSCASPCRANGPLDLPEAFMEKLVAGRAAEAVDEYFATNPLVARKTQQIQYIKKQIATAFDLFGRPSSYELAIADDLSASLKRYVFITKHAHHALTWEFYSYRPGDTWIASNLNFNDDFSLLQRRK